MSKTRTTLFPNGVSNASPNTFAALANLRLLDPTKYHTYFNDFDTYNAAEWNVEEVGVAVQTLNNLDGGNLAILNAGADDNSSFQQLVGESFLWASNREMWFAARFATPDATQTDIVMGLQILDTTPLDVSDGIFFIKNDGADTVDFVIEKANTPTITVAVATLVDAIGIVLAWHYDGIGTFTVYADDVLVATITDTANAPDVEVLTISFGIQNGEAAIKGLDVDYVLAVKER